jgi:hypothetical protein
VLVINPSSVGMGPVRSLPFRLLQPPARSVSTIVQRDTQGGGRNEAYRLLRLVNIPTVVGMVPVRSLLHRFLQNPPARSVSTIVQRDMQDGVW